MSVIYKIFEACMRGTDVKHLYDMPEDEFIKYLKRTQRPENLPEGFYRKFDTVRLSRRGNYVFYIKPKSAAPNRSILFLHGGGGILAPMRLHYRFARKLVSNTGAELALPFYPLAPEANARESAEWVKSVYEDMTLTRNAKDITVIGDSAGALLAALLVSTVDNKPGGVVMISPITGIDKTDTAAMRARHEDLVLSERLIDMAGKYWGEGIPLDSADFNAEYIDYSGFPPVVLYYGTNEMFAPHMCRLIMNIKQHAPIETHRGEGLCHDWAVSDAFPEGRRALRRICNFVDRKNF